MSKRKNLSLALIVAVCATASGCGVINKLRAKNSLNDGVRHFNKGQFELAQAKFERALELSPDLTNAQLFYARAVNARFDQTLTTDLGYKTVAAYDNIIERNRDNHQAVDQALAFKAKAYERLAELQPEEYEQHMSNRRKTLLERTELPAADDETKAAVFYTLGQGYWEQAYRLSVPYTKNIGGRIEYQQIPPDIVDKMKPLVSNAHEYLQKALSYKPDYADAWAIQKLTYIEENKIETDSARKTQILAAIKEAENNAKKYYEQQRQAQPAAGTGGDAQPAPSR